jgi:hypothetical protein
MQQRPCHLQVSLQDHNLGKYLEKPFINAEDFIRFLFKGDTSSMPKPPQKWEQSLTFKTFPAAANEMAKFIGDFMREHYLFSVLAFFFADI